MLRQLDSQNNKIRPNTIEYRLSTILDRAWFYHKTSEALFLRFNHVRNKGCPVTGRAAQDITMRLNAKLEHCDNAFSAKIGLLSLWKDRNAAKKWENYRSHPVSYFKSTILDYPRFLIILRFSIIRDFWLSMSLDYPRSLRSQSLRIIKTPLRNVLLYTQN